MSVARIALAVAAAASALASSPAFAQGAQFYGKEDRYYDHRWVPDNSGFNSGVSAVPVIAPGKPGEESSFTPEPIPKTPDKPAAATGTWKYAYDGRLWLQGTAGFAVVGATLGCYDNATGGQGAASICGAAPAAVGSCIFNGYGVGNCTSGVPFTGQFSQQTYTANTSWFWD